VEGELTEAMKDLDGKDKVIIYCEKEKSRIKWGNNRNICITSQLLEMLKKRFGDRNIETT
jgi:DNA polymerase-3 subunit alpha